MRYVFKRILVILLALTLVLSLSGCGIKEKINEKVTEKITESVLEKVGGEGTDIDFDQGTLTLKGQDGESVTFGAGEWPEDGAADLIPEFKKGTVASVMNSETACMIVITEVDQDDYESYVEKMKDRGYTNDVTESSDQFGILYSASSDDGSIIGLTYLPDSQEFVINFEVGE